LSRLAIVSFICTFVVVPYAWDPSGGWVWHKIYYCLLLSGAFSILGQLPVNKCSKWCSQCVVCSII